MSITYLEAIREAQAHALRDDPRVFIYGQDVGAFGGAFKATKGLAKEYPGRVLDAPISEDAIIGSAIGAASATMSSPTPISASVWGMPTRFRSAIVQSTTLAADCPGRSR